jgi:hypothetical protein
MCVNGTRAEDKLRSFKSECAHFSFNKCPIYGTSAKDSTNSYETDNSARALCSLIHKNADFLQRHIINNKQKLRYDLVVILPVVKCRNLILIMNLYILLMAM